MRFPFLVNTIGNLIFKGTSVAEQKVLDISLMEESAENAVINGDIVLMVFGAIIVAALIIGIVSKIRNTKKYAEISQ